MKRADHHLRLTSVTHSGGTPPVSASDDASGCFASRSNSEATDHHDYDATPPGPEMVIWGSSGTVVSSYTYGMNAMGQRSSVETAGTAFGFCPPDRGWEWGYKAWSGGAKRSTPPITPWTGSLWGILLIYHVMQTSRMMTYIVINLFRIFVWWFIRLLSKKCVNGFYGCSIKNWNTLKDGMECFLERMADDSSEFFNESKIIIQDLYFDRGGFVLSFLPPFRRFIFCIPISENEDRESVADKIQELFTDFFSAKPNL